MATLQNLARAIGKSKLIKPWHIELAKLIPPNAVIYMFLDAEIREDVMFFEDNDALERAYNFKSDVERIFPNICMASRTVVLPWNKRQKLGAGNEQTKHRG